MWCWASTLAGLLQASMPAPMVLAEPQKPQVLATTGGYARAGSNFGPSSLHWWDSRFGKWIQKQTGPPNVLDYLRAKSRAEVEGLSFAKFPYLAYYLVKMLDAGYAVALDMRSRTHMVNAVGYDEEGVWLQDPNASRPLPEHWQWQFFFRVIDGGLGALSGNYVITTVIERPLAEADRVLSINTPSCEWSAPSASILNKNGVYFSTPADRMFAGFLWDGTRPHGLQLASGGEVSAPQPDPVGVLPVGGKTRMARGTSRWAIRAAISRRPDPRGPRAREERTSRSGLRIRNLMASPRTVSTHDGPEVALLPLLPKEQTGAESYLVTATLLAGGREVDRVDMPLDIVPFRLDSIVPEPTLDGRSATG